MDRGAQEAARSAHDLMAVHQAAAHRANYEDRVAAVEGRTMVRNLVVAHKPSAQCVAVPLGGS